MKEQLAKERKQLETIKTKQDPKKGDLKYILQLFFYLFAVLATDLIFTKGKQMRVTILLI
jgi:hypothetical protein